MNASVGPAGYLKLLEEKQYCSLGTMTSVERLEKYIIYCLSLYYMIQELQTSVLRVTGIALNFYGRSVNTSEAQVNHIYVLFMNGLFSFQNLYLIFSLSILMIHAPVEQLS